MKKIVFWFYRIFNPKRCLIGIDEHTGGGEDYSCLVYGYLDRKKRVVIVGEKLWVEE